jgi:hypothetical protein
MTQITIYLSVIRGEESLTIDGSLYLANELFKAFTTAAKGTSDNQTVTNQPTVDAITPRVDEAKDLQPEHDAHAS